VACAAAGADPDATGDRARLDLDCGYPVTVWRELLAGFDGLLSEFRPDIVCTHLAGAIEVIRRARRFGARPAWFFRNPECADHPPAQLEEARALGCRFFASSRFLAEHMETSHQIRATILFPPVEVDRYRVPLNQHGCITMVNPVVEKGLMILVGLLLQLPEHPFLVVEGWPRSPGQWQDLQRVLGRFPNVRLLRAVPDMREVYRQTRILLVPSLWREGFGRVAAEAQASGIPAIASRVGHLAELTAGTLLVDDFTSAEAWADAIRHLWSDRLLYQELSAQARAHARTAEYRAERVARRFLEADQPRQVSAADGETGGQVGGDQLREGFRSLR
jgi:glycosyltransferase involved in cell wall biosynthesis